MKKIPQIILVRETTGVMRREEDVNMDLKITAFFPKNPSMPKWVPLFIPGNVLRFTGKFILNKQPPTDLNN